MPAFGAMLGGMLRVGDIPGTDVLILPLAFSIGMTVATIFHIISFHRECKRLYPLEEIAGMASVLRTFFDTLFVSVVMSIVAYTALNALDSVFSINTFLGIFSQGLCAGLLAIAVGVGALLLIKNREIREIWQTLHKKFWHVPVIGPDAEDVI